MRHLQLFLIFSLCSLFSFGQQRKIDSLKNALNKNNSQKSKLFILESLNSLLINETSLNEALPYFNEMASVAKSLNNSKLETKAYKYISEVYMKKIDSSKAFFFAKKALTININNNNLNGYLLDINQLGRAYYHFQLYGKAIETYNKGIEKYNENGGKNELKIVSTIYSNLSVAYDKSGQTDKSIESILKGVEIAEKTNTPNQKSYSLYLLGYKYMSLENYKKAEEYFLKSLKFSKSVSLKVYVFANHHGLGINYSRWGKYEKALEHNKKALEFYRKQGNTLYEFDALNNTAVIYIHQKQFKKALTYGKEALKIARKTNRKIAIVGAKSTISTVLINLKQYNKAKQYLNEILKDTIAINQTDDSFKMSIYANLSEVYKAKGDYKQGLYFFEKYKQFNDSVQRKTLESKFTEIETKYQSEKKEKENLKLKAENAEQTLLTQKANTQKWFLTLGLLLITITAFFIWLRYKSETKAKAVISQQKDKIENLQKELHHRIKNNLAIIDTFIEVAKEEFDDKMFDEKLTEIQNRISSINEIHKQLYFNQDITNLSIKKYVDIITKNVSQSFKNKNIIINNKIENIKLNADTSFPVGLIINEFLTNSYKYAFNQEKGQINIELKEENSIYLLRLSDNGKGFSKDFNIEETQTFGLRIMKLLTKQINGDFDLRNNNGVQLDIKVPKV